MPREQGSAAQGDCLESLGMLRNSRRKRNTLGAVIHRGCRTAGSAKTHSCGSNFQKLPSAEAFHQLLQTLPLQPWACERPLGSAGLKAQTLAGRSLASLHSFTLIVTPVPGAWQRLRRRSALRSSTRALPDRPSPSCGLALSRLLPTVPLTCSLFLWLQWFA